MEKVASVLLEISVKRFQPTNNCLTKEGDAALLVRLAVWYFNNSNKLLIGSRRNPYGLPSFVFDSDSIIRADDSSAPLARFQFTYIKCAKCGRIHQSSLGNNEAIVVSCNACTHYFPFRPTANPFLPNTIGLNDSDCEAVNLYLCKQYHKQLGG